MSSNSKKKLPKSRYQIERCATALLEGRVLAIDPSSGSQSSLPGYALFDKGELIDHGVIKLKISRELPRRLNELGEALKTEFPAVDVLVIEDIPVRSYGKGASPHASLLKAVGCILACCTYREFVEISPPTWKAYVRRNPERFSKVYEKSDDLDAWIIGQYALDTAREILGRV